MDEAEQQRVRDRVQAAQERFGACCPHPAKNHIWLSRGGVLYSTACELCECLYWRDKPERFLWKWKPDVTTTLRFGMVIWRWEVYFRVRSEWMLLKMDAGSKKYVFQIRRLSQ